jgi:stress-induced-phosphoprotein 1
VLLAAGILSGLALSTHKQIATWKDSVTLWENLLTIQPQNSSFAYASMAEAYKDAGQLDEAKLEIEIAMKMNPESPGYYAMRGEISLKKQLVDEAIQDFNTSISLIRSVSLGPTGYYPHWNLASAYVQKGKYPEALAEAQEAIKMKSDDPEAYHVMGLAYAGLNQFQKSIEAYQKALSLEPDHYNPVYLRDLTTACMNSVHKKKVSPRDGYFKR